MGCMKSTMAVLILSLVLLSCNRSPIAHVPRRLSAVPSVVLMTEDVYVSSLQDGIHTGYILEGERESLPILHEDFTRTANYPYTHSVWLNQELMAQSVATRKVLILLGNQRGLYLVDNEVAMDFPVCTGRGSKRTPTGSFCILQKDIDHYSNLYDCPMPYFMRLTWSGIGMHVGDVYRTPASHGCIRMPRVACEPLYRALSYGSRVTITE